MAVNSDPYDSTINFGPAATTKGVTSLGTPDSLTTIAKSLKDNQAFSKSFASTSITDVALQDLLNFLINNVLRVAQPLVFAEIRMTEGTEKASGKALGAQLRSLSPTTRDGLKRRVEDFVFSFLFSRANDRSGDRFKAFKEGLKVGLTIQSSGKIVTKGSLVSPHVVRLGHPSPALDSEQRQPQPSPPPVLPPPSAASTPGNGGDGRNGNATPSVTPERLASPLPSDGIDGAGGNGGGRTPERPASPSPSDGNDGGNENATPSVTPVTSRPASPSPSDGNGESPVSISNSGAIPKIVITEYFSADDLLNSLMRQSDDLNQVDNVDDIEPALAILDRLIDYVDDQIKTGEALGTDTLDDHVLKLNQLPLIMNIKDGLPVDRSRLRRFLEKKRGTLRGDGAREYHGLSVGTEQQTPIRVLQSAVNGVQSAVSSYKEALATQSGSSSQNGLSTFF